MKGTIVEQLSIYIFAFQIQFKHSCNDNYLKKKTWGEGEFFIKFYDFRKIKIKCKWS